LINAKLLSQLGTLGGGNHHLEIGASRDGRLAITVHSGSRNPGKTIGSFYMNKTVTEDTDLPKGFFHVGGEWGQQYIEDHNKMCQYAYANRQKMLWDTLEILGIKFEKSFIVAETVHNHTIQNKDFVLHRKGAIPAFKGDLCAIPINMRDGVYIVEGLGNEEFFCSASHGAGRAMSRKEAKKKIDMEVFTEQMVGIIGMVSKETIDEAPDAYKSMESVIGRQEGIVFVTRDVIKPLINIKGTK
jgi:tRNA-splicing ligase RtcB